MADIETTSETATPDGLHWLAKQHYREQGTSPIGDSDWIPYIPWLEQYCEALLEELSLVYNHWHSPEEMDEVMQRVAQLEGEIEDGT